MYQFGAFRLDVSERRLTRDTLEIPLPHKVFTTLRLLVESAGKLMTREHLLGAVWSDVAVEEGNLNHVISTIRNALGEQATGQSFIETVPRVGYRFVADVTEIAAAPNGPKAKTAGGCRSRQEIRFCVTRDDVNIAYAKTGSGYPLVKSANWLNHLDFEWDSPIWRHWLCELGRHHTIIRYDERGNGLSDWDVDDISFEAWVQDLEAVIDASRFDRFALMGISQGGPVAIAYAVRHPERISHLILCGAYSRGWRRRGQSEADLEARGALTTLVRLDWGRNNPSFSQLFTDRFIPENAKPEHQRWFSDLQRMTASGENAARIMQTFDQIDVRSLLPSVSVPTLVLHSDRDVAVPIEEGRILAAEIPNAKFVLLPSANHLLLEEEPAWGKFLEELGAFLHW